MFKQYVCKITHLPTGRYYLSTPTNLESTREIWRHKLKTGSALLPHTVRVLLNGQPANPEEWRFEVLGEHSYQDYGAARAAADALLMEHIKAVGWDMLLNVDAFVTDEQGRRVRTPESTQRRREANGTGEWGQF